MLTQTQEDRARALFERAAFVDAADTTTVTPQPGIQTGPYLDSEFVAKLRKGKFSVIAFNNFFWLFEDFYNAVRRFADFYQTMEGLADTATMVRDYDDVEDSIRSGKVAILVYSQNSSIIDNDIRLLRVLARLGLRVMQLTHQGRSLAADGRGEKNPGGLSRFGELIVGEMNRHGILLDLAHASRQTIMDALELSKDPVVLSHTCMLEKYFTKGKRDVDLAAGRSISDEEAKAVASKDGVIGIMGIPSHLTDVGHLEGASMKTFGDHLEHLIDVAGINHAGVGLELSYKKSGEDLEMNFTKAQNQFGGRYTPITDIFPKGYTFKVGNTTRGLENYETMKLNIVRELVDRGYSDSEIEKVLGLNFLRVYKQVFGRL